MIQVLYAIYYDASFISVSPLVPYLTLQDSACKLEKTALMAKGCCVMNLFEGKTIGFIGGGEMTSAIVCGMVKSGLIAPDRITVTDTHSEKLEKLRAETCVRIILNDRRSGCGMLQLIRESDIIVLSVKPQSLDELLQSVSDALRPGQLVVSIVSGVNLEKLERSLPVPVVRVMPSTPATVGAGIAGIVPGSACSDEEVRLVTGLFETVGKTYRIPESMIVPISSVGGSAPAYVYMFIEALANAGAELGFSHAAALEIAAQATLGAAKMVLESGVHPAVLKENVCSPGGSTIAGVHSLEQSGLRAAVMDAILAGKNRVREIERECS